MLSKPMFWKLLKLVGGCMSLYYELKLRRALVITKRFVENYGKVYVMFSGGKDSLVALDIVYRAVGSEGIRAVVFQEMTGNTAKEAVEYVYSVVDMYGLRHKFIHQKLPYDHLDAFKRWGLPLYRGRWCRGEKWKLARKLQPPWLWVIGIKASDSSLRASSQWNKYIVELPRLKEVALQPVIEFTNQDIWYYIKARDLPINPCYEKYGFCGVCMFCPFHDSSTIEKVMSDERWCEKIVDVLMHIRSRSRYTVTIIRRYVKYAKCLSEEEKRRILDSLVPVPKEA